MRQKYKPWAEEYLENNSQLVIANGEAYKGNWQAAFGNQRAIHLEIGTGKGQFLVGMAKQFPEINFIGIELEKNVIVTAVQKIIDSGLDNILLLNENAADLEAFFAESEISTLYLNFSDPWPKRRHTKRRLTYHTFLKQYQTILQPESEIILKTDNQGLFEYSLVSFSEYGLKLKEVVLNLHNFQDPQNVMTEYEEKFSAKGQPIYRCKAVF